MPVTFRSPDTPVHLLVDETLDDASRRHLDATRAALHATRALSSAGPGETADAYRRLEAAVREQADAERAYERLRQQVHAAAYTGRPRFRRY